MVRSTKVQEFGPYFEVVELTPPVAAGWIPVAEMIRDGGLEQRVEQTHRSLLAREQTGGRPLGRTPADRRAVASTVSLGLFSRLLSPSIGAALAGRPSARPDLWTTLARAAPSGPGDIATTAPLIDTASPEETLEAVAMPVLDAFSAQFGVPEQVLRGNLAAAVVGACDVVSGVAPTLRRRARELRRDLVRHELLEGTGTTEGPFVRSSCCLIHRLPVGFVCGNCPLVDRDTPTARRLQGRA